ncbi:MAG: HrpE/YscL family type III secretion apparatus protein [Chlamydiae bacterium]|nr:HrpE/YscL family type III secretion apparatus protein [Chlamydiota bacterium]
MKLFSYIFSGSIHTHSESKIIQAKELGQLLEAQSIIQKAQEEAKQLHVQTEEECEKLRQKAQAEGFQQGLREFNTHILSLNEEVQKIYHDMQRMVLPLALKAAQKIVKKEIETFPNTIVDIVMQVITAAKNNKCITIFANKKDIDALEQSKTKIKQMLDQVQVLSVQEKEDVSPGGCIIETEAGIINASIENQWLALELAFDRYKS